MTFLEPLNNPNQDIIYQPTLNVTTRTNIQAYLKASVSIDGLLSLSCAYADHVNALSASNFCVLRLSTWYIA